MRIHCVYSSAQLGYMNGSLNPHIWPAIYDNVLEGMYRCGATVTEEKKFIVAAGKGQVSPDDKIISFFMADDLTERVFSHTSPPNRWTYIIDTKVRDDGTGAYEGRVRDYFPRFGVTHALIALPLAKYTQVLTDAGIKTVVMPLCVPGRRSRTPKHNGVVTVGSFNEHVYPTRTRLMHLFREKLSDVSGAPTPRGEVARYCNGNAARAGGPILMGAAYYDMLDSCQMGVVCRGGNRDYLVVKYAEFGMCHVLPVGDCPSYMPTDMKAPMIDVEHMSDDDVVTEVRRLLADPTELAQRQDAYTEATHKHYDMLTNCRRALSEIAYTQ
jgi:hypothetical protein